MQSLLEWSFLDNTLLSWLTAAVAWFIVMTSLATVRGIVARRFGPYHDSISPTVLIRAVFTSARVWWFLVLATYCAAYFLSLPQRVENVVHVVTVVATFLQVAIWSNVVLGLFLDKYTTRKLDDDPASATGVRTIGFLSRLGVWVLVILLMMSNLGIKVGPLLAGLGVGGIAIALAVQTVLGDLLASLSITMDKPFVVGDFIIVDEMVGTVEMVGIKTTRVKSLSGEQLVISNSDLLSSRIRNYKQMQERRIVFSFRVGYDTSREKLIEIPEIVREIVEAQTNTKFDRAHFHLFGPSSLDFEVVYYMLVPDYNEYMDTQQEINLELMRRFEEEGIRFALPAQAIYLNSSTAEIREAIAGS